MQEIMDKVNIAYKAAKLAPKEYSRLTYRIVLWHLMRQGNYGINE